MLIGAFADAQRVKRCVTRDDGWAALAGIVEKNIKLLTSKYGDVGVTAGDVLGSEMRGMLAGDWFFIQRHNMRPLKLANMVGHHTWLVFRGSLRREEAEIRKAKVLAAGEQPRETTRRSTKCNKSRQVARAVANTPSPSTTEHLPNTPSHNSTTLEVSVECGGLLVVHCAGCCVIEVLVNKQPAVRVTCRHTPDQGENHDFVRKPG